ncbi:hypothetical protein TorRG33x02_235300 [Trema orientale]|uniref:Uncharacterized protein n=1 Tax=Trema orientale TaxID=63057 RepID=A0A2P5E208_TREOI|nr:hypothetical protein TorRG33x02_235300 [Trema orientale]
MVKSIQMELLRYHEAGMDRRDVCIKQLEKKTRQVS